MEQTTPVDRFNTVRGETLADQVYRHLAHELLAGAYAPLDRLNIRQLAREFNLSATPVREAILRLAFDGVLQTTEKNAIIVPERKPEEIREIFEIRRMLEGELSAAAAKALTKEDVAFFSETQEQFQAALKDEDYKQALRLNSRLHFRIYGAADMPIRYKIVESLWLRIGPTLRNMYPILNKVRRGESPHNAIIEQAKLKNSDGLRDAVVEDLNASELALSEYIRQTSFPEETISKKLTER